MLKGKHVYNVCIVRTENNYFRVKIGHPFKVKFICHRGKTILHIILGVAGCSMVRCLFSLIPKSHFLRTALEVIFSVHDLFCQLILAPHLPLRTLSVFFVPKVHLGYHRFFDGVGCNWEEYIMQVTGDNPSIRTFL